MKSDRRHELQQNELAAYLGRINQSVEPYSRVIAVVVGTVVVAAIAYGLYTSKASGDRSDATLQLILSAGSRDADIISIVGDSYPQTPAGAWSRLYEGDQFLAEGMRSLYLNRSEARSQLEEARTAYRSALANSDDQLIRSRAHFGIARVAESLGEVNEAVAEYGECIAVNESKAMVDLAQQRIDALSKPGTKEFLAWFSEQDFSPADPSLPPSLPSGVTLPDLPDLDLPDLDLPDLKLPDLGGAEKEKDLDGGIGMPKKEPAESTDTDDPAAEPSEPQEPKADATGDPALPAKEAGDPAETDPVPTDSAPSDVSEDSDKGEDAVKSKDSAQEPAADDPS